MREKKKKRLIIFSMIGLLFIMASGYAAFRTNLDIKGTSSINSNWDIRITNVTEANKNGDAETVSTNFSDLTAYMEANLYNKGDYVEYDVTIENKGTFDAKLSDIITNVKSNNEAVLITFSGYTKGETLYKETSKIIKVKIEYNPNYEGEEVGITSKSVDVNFETDGDVVAKVSDGTNSVSSSYTVVRYNLYVSSKGSDTTGRGTIEKPYATLQKAYDEASYKANIYVMDNITVNNTTNFNEDKDITLTSYSTNDTINSIIRGTSLTSHIIDQTAGDLTLKNITVNGNNVEAQFAMINVGGNTTMETGTTITKANNVNNYGGGISVNGGVLTINDGEIKENKTEQGGGAIFVFRDDENEDEHEFEWKKGTLTINGGTFENNTATGGGGVIANYGDLYIKGGNFLNNSAAYAGGAVWNSGDFYIDDGNIMYNSTEHNGGGIFNIGTLNVKGGNIIENNADVNGGGIYNGSNLTINSGEVSGNNANGTGGGIYSSGTSGGNATLNISGDLLVDKNWAYSTGGGISAFYTNFTMNGGTVSNNTVTRYNGGGIKIDSNSIGIINNGTISNNSAVDGAGLAVITNSTVTMNGGTITNNNATHNGGGVFIYVASKFTLNGGVIKSNTATNGDGGIYILNTAGTCTYTYQKGTVTGNKPTNQYEIS